MQMQCAASCKRCLSGDAPATTASPPPTCATLPDSGAACGFFFSTIANPCSLESAGDAFIATWTTANCQTSCGICAPEPATPTPSPVAELSPAAPTVEPAPEPATPTPSPVTEDEPSTEEEPVPACADLESPTFACRDVVVSAGRG